MQILKIADVAMHVHHHQQLPAEIVKQLRQNFKQPTRRYHRESKVRIRTDRYYKPEKGRHHWRQKYNRHVKQMKCGFYTPAHVPYETVGDVGLDIKELVFNTIGKEDKKIALKKQWKAVLAKKEVKIDEQPQKAKQQKDKDGKSSKDPRSVYSKGGYQVIRDKLRVDANRMTVLRAGLPYSDCRRQEAEAKAMELLREQQNQPEPCISPTRLRQILSKMRVSERSESQCEEGETTGIDTISREDSHEDILNQRGVRERNCRNLSSKLNSLYTLLCHIYQLRSRDLRTKNPLSKDFLKSLKHAVPLDQRGRIIRNPRHTATGNPSSNSRGGYPHRASTDALESRMEGDTFSFGSPHMLTRPSDFHESVSYLFRGGVGDSRTDSRTTFVAKKLAKLEERTPRLKESTPKALEMTWDDLVEGRSSMPPSLGGVGMVGLFGETSSRGAPVRSSFAQSVRHVFRRRRTGILHHLPQNATASSQPTEHLTIWQQVAANEKNAKEFKSTGVTRLIQLQRRRSRRYSRSRTLRDIVGEGFNEIRFKTAAAVKDKLKQIESQEEKVFDQKFRALKPLHLYEVDMNTVRQVGSKVNKDYKNENLKPAQWYNELHKEADISGLNNELEINQLLNRFYPFAIDDVHTVPFVRAKLCLLIQSLPIYDLCTIPMQEAIQFLMMHILDCTQSTVNEWMTNRKIDPLPRTLH